jgi:phosphoribosyl 1,2-cyclic phosphodiesterase
MIKTNLLNENIHVLWATETIEDTIVIEEGEEGMALHQGEDLIFLTNEQIDHIIKLRKKKK